MANEKTEHIYPTIGRGIAAIPTGRSREEVVRCPDCKKNIEDEPMGEFTYCAAFHGWYACEKGFCHMAERKETSA